jgi:quercetin dioxygenase-like cupin family protein
MTMSSIEKTLAFTQTESKIVERIIEDQNVGINHMVLRKGEALPEHFTNSNVYMIVVRGGITLQLGDQETHAYSSGSIINIPYNIKMNASNQNPSVLEFFVIKAPSPPFYKA